MPFNSLYLSMYQYNHHHGHYTAYDNSLSLIDIVLNILHVEII